MSTAGIIFRAPAAAESSCPGSRRPSVALVGLAGGLAIGSDKQINMHTVVNLNASGVQSKHIAALGRCTPGTGHVCPGPAGMVEEVMSKRRKPPDSEHAMTSWESGRKRRKDASAHKACVRNTS